MYNLLIKSSDDNEITQTARVINAVDDPHKLISNIAIQLNDSIDSTVSRIVSMIEHCEEWITYIAPIDSWINENKNI
jgi:hypothetical protein